MKAVILAGGIEVSPSPYNQIFPKPMLPVGNRPILELALNQFKKQGFSDFHLVISQTGGQLIQTYFGDGSHLGIQIQYHWEKSPMGSAGAISLVEGLEETFFVMNSDVLTTLDFNDFLALHRKEEAGLTVACHKMDIYLDFGFIELDGDHVVGYREKPTLHRWINMGIYAMEPRILRALPPDHPFDMGQFLDRLIEKKEKVVAYEEGNYWLDIGNREDYEKANREFDSLKEHFAL